MDIERDERWHEAARQVANELDRHDPRASADLRGDLYALQNDPRAQHEFVNMVNREDRTGVRVSLDEYGREHINFAGPNYGGDYQQQRPMYPPPGAYPPGGGYYQQPNPGEVVGGAIVGGVIGGLLGGALRRR